MKRPALLTQVLAVNAALIAATVLAASITVRLDPDTRRLGLLAAAVLATVLVNGLVLRRRFAPLEDLIAAMESVDFTARRSEPAPVPGEVQEVARLRQAFDRMLARVEDERARTAGAVLHAQEGERARVARDLHDEANQALTGVLLRLSATAQNAPPALRDELRETQRVATQAMEELVRLARELRPAALDDLGLDAALRTLVGELRPPRAARATSSRWRPARSTRSRPTTASSSTASSRRRSRTSRATPARARSASAPSAPGTDTVVRIADDGRGFDPASARSGLGLMGMRERARARRRQRPRALRPACRHRRRAARWEAAHEAADRRRPRRRPRRPAAAARPPARHGGRRRGRPTAPRRSPGRSPTCPTSRSSMSPCRVLTGLQATREIKARAPEVDILILSMHDDERYLFEALKAGASGYVLKQKADQDLVDAVRAVARGESFLTNSAQGSLVREWMADSSRGPREPLSPREQEVLKLIAEAHTNREIGEILGMAEKTVESHRGSILRKLGMRDRVELVRYAIRRGLVEP